MKHYITNLDFSTEDLQGMIDAGKAFKAQGHTESAKGKVLTAIFYNPSLRTLLSFQTGMQKMGGICNVLSMENSRILAYGEGEIMNGDASEHIKEFVKVVGAYSDVLAVRKSDFIPDKNNVTEAYALAGEKEAYLADEFFKFLVKYSDKPVINMESNMFHPCQALGDMLTMQEILGDVKKKKYVLTWAPHPKPLPLATPHSQIIVPGMFGMDVTLACPEGFELAPEIMDQVKDKAQAQGGSFTIEHDQDKAFEGADIICAKSYLGLKYFGDFKVESKVREGLKHWQVTSEKMAKTNNAKFMHCLPVRRNVVVSDEVLDSESSVIIQEAENRMWAQMGIISYLLNQ